MFNVYEFQVRLKNTSVVKLLKDFAIKDESQLIEKATLWHESQLIEKATCPRSITDKRYQLYIFVIIELWPYPKS